MEKQRCYPENATHKIKIDTTDFGKIKYTAHQKIPLTKLTGKTPMVRKCLNKYIRWRSIKHFYNLLIKWKQKLANDLKIFSAKENILMVNKLMEKCSLLLIIRKI